MRDLFRPNLVGICFMGEIDLFEKIRQNIVYSNSSGKHMFLWGDEAASFTDKHAVVLHALLLSMCY